MQPQDEAVAAGTRGWYLGFAEEARGSSPVYERLALAVADDTELMARLSRLPPPKRQPNLLFGAARFLGGPVGDPHHFGRWAVRNWDEVAVTMLARRTQTNEVGRVATLLPVLAGLPGPLALLEVGASAGLCLYPDRFHYRYRRAHGAGEHALGDPDSAVSLGCRVSGPAPLPDHLPEVVWRAGIDLNPLDVTDADDMRWLQAMVWPDQPERDERLRAAIGIARCAPPHLVAGDLMSSLESLVALAPGDATLVIFHSAVLAYLPAGQRESFAQSTQDMPGHWVSNEGRSVLPGLDEGLPDTGTTDLFLLALDGRPLAWTGPHGQYLDWFDDAPA